MLGFLYFYINTFRIYYYYYYYYLSSLSRLFKIVYLKQKKLSRIYIVAAILE